MVFVLACAASGLLYLHRYAWGVIKPYVRDENPGLTDTQLGWIDSAFMMTYAVGQVPGGMLADRFGPRVVVSALILLWSLATAAVVGVLGLVPLLLVRGALGLAQAGGYPALSRLSRDWFPAHVRTSLQGMMTACGRVGGALSSIVVATLFMGLCGLTWQTSVVLLASLGVPVALLFWLALANGGRKPPDAATDQGANAPRSPATKTEYARDPATLLSFGMMLLYAFASTFQDQLYVYWLADFLKQGHGLDATQMGLFGSLPLFGGVIGGVAGGILNDVLVRRMRSRRWARSSIAIAGKLVAAILIAVSVQMPDGRVAMIVLFLARCFGDWSLPTQWGAVTDMGGRAVGTIFGVVNMVGALGGAVAGPVLGSLKTHYGWEGLFYGAAAMCLVASATWLFIDCTRRVVAD